MASTFTKVGIEIDYASSSELQGSPIRKSGGNLLAFAQQFLRLGQRDFMKMDLIAGPKLRCDRQIHCDHVGDSRIAANGLAITEQQNRLPFGGTCTVPGATASESRSLESIRSRSGPSSRTPIRSESPVTVKAASRNEVCASSVKRDQWFLERFEEIRSFIVFTQDDGAVQLAILR